MKPRILMTNDDGIDAPGLAELRSALGGIADVTVVAPESEQSGSAHALTIRRPLRVRRRTAAQVAIDGTPTDCIHLGLTRILERAPDLVVAGINQGSNVGRDVTYSGTVAAALEGTLLGIPAFAISLQMEGEAPDFGPAALFGRRLAERILAEGLPAGTYLNVNVPGGPIAGVRWTRQGRQGFARAGRDADGNGNLLWIHRHTGRWDADPEADFVAVRDGWISVTPLLADWTHHDARHRMAGWDLPAPDRP